MPHYQQNNQGVDGGSILMDFGAAYGELQLTATGTRKRQVHQNIKRSIQRLPPFALLTNLSRYFKK
jgi:hypothetical protein